MAIIFVRVNFDNSRTVRQLPYSGIHAWAMDAEEWDWFRFTYANLNPIIIGSPDDYQRIGAISYKDVDRYVMGLSDTVPPIVPFDPDQHCLIGEVRELPNILGELEQVIWYATNWQVILDYTPP